jgi:competence protein ComEA
MSPQHEEARGLLARVKQALAASAWTSLAGRGAAYLVGFVLLALVGSGRLARWMSPPPALGIGVAEAATPPPAPAAAPEAATAAPSAEAAPAGTEVASPAEADAGTSSPGVAPDGKVILNLATEEDLRRLPGVGRGKAKAILALRGQMKKFTRVEDLLKVKGIGKRALARMKPLVRVD